jgi:hypothetical protein
LKSFLFVKVGVQFLDYVFELVYFVRSIVSNDRRRSAKILLAFRSVILVGEVVVEVFVSSDIPGGAMDGTPVHGETSERHSDNIHTKVFEEMVEFNFLLFDDHALGTDAEHVG